MHEHMQGLEVSPSIIKMKYLEVSSSRIKSYSRMKMKRFEGYTFKNDQNNPTPMNFMFLV